jgi:hypothetical protein
VKKRLMTSLATGVLMAAMLPGAALGAVEENARESIVGDVFEDICGETLTHTAGDLHMVISFTENDHRISGGYHFNPQGAKLEDESGRVYSGTGVGRGHFSEPVDENGAATFTAVDSFKLIGHGSAPNFLLQVVFHSTINANGDVTVEFERVSEECK